MCPLVLAPCPDPLAYRIPFVLKLPDETDNLVHQHDHGAGSGRVALACGRMSGKRACDAIQDAALGWRAIGEPAPDAGQCHTQRLQLSRSRHRLRIISCAATMFAHELRHACMPAALSSASLVPYG